MLVSAFLDRATSKKMPSNNFVIVEQNIDLGLRVTNKACVMHRGEIVLSGSAKEIQKDNRLKQYLAP